MIEVKPSMKKVFKILLWMLISLIGLILIAGLITQTSFFKGWLKDIAVSELNQILNANTSIGEIEGNLFSNLVIQDVLFIMENDTLGSVEEIYISYNLFKFLSDEIHVNALTIKYPRFFLSEDSVQGWNVTNVIHQDESLPDTLSPEEKEPFQLKIVIDSFNLQDGYAEIKANDDLISEKISNLNLKLNGLYCTDSLAIQLDNLAFQSERPNLLLKKLSFSFRQDHEGLYLKNLVIQTDENTIISDATYQELKNNHLNLNANNLNLSEFEFILPGFSLNKNPDIQIESNFNRDSLQLVIDIGTEDESFNIKAKAVNYQSFFEDINSDPIHFSLNLLIPQLRVT